MTFAITDDAVAALVDDIRLYGQRGVESGAWLLAGSQDRNQVVSAKALSRLFEWAADDDLVVVAQVHSHLFSAFMSEADSRFGFRAEGFVSSIVPNAREAPPSPAGWGWWVLAGGAWHAGTPALVTPGSAQIVWFDEDGVRD